MHSIRYVHLHIHPQTSKGICFFDYRICESLCKVPYVLFLSENNSCESLIIRLIVSKIRRWISVSKAWVLAFNFLFLSLKAEWESKIRDIQWWVTVSFLRYLQWSMTQLRPVLALEKPVPKKVSHHLLPANVQQKEPGCKEEVDCILGNQTWMQMPQAPA